MMNSFFDRRKKKCIRFVAGNSGPQDGSEIEEGVNATQGSGVETITSANVELRGQASLELVKPEPLVT